MVCSSATDWPRSRTTPAPLRSTPPRARHCSEAWRSGLDDIVIATRQTPATVRALYLEWTTPLGGRPRNKEDAEEREQAAHEEMMREGIVTRRNAGGATGRGYEAGVDHLRRRARASPASDLASILIDPRPRDDGARCSRQSTDAALVPSLALMLGIARPRGRSLRVVALEKRRQLLSAPVFPVPNHAVGEHCWISRATH